MLKNTASLSLVLFASFSILSHADSSAAEKCSAEKIAMIQKMIKPDISQNSKSILSLLDGAITGSVDCEMKSSPAPGGGFSLGTCGYSYPKDYHQITLKAPSQTWNLSVREDTVECTQNGGYWLTALSTSYGKVVAQVKAGDRIVAQIESNGCETASDYQVIKFSYKDGNSKLKNVSQLVNVVGARSCDGEEKQEALIELSAFALGL